jgi:putative ABC transport system permease protein
MVEAFEDELEEIADGGAGRTRLAMLWRAFVDSLSTAGAIRWAAWRGLPGAPLSRREVTSPGWPARSQKGQPKNSGGCTGPRDRVRPSISRRFINALDGLLIDLGFALRALRRTPGFTAVALLTLALGIGSTTAMFSVVNTAMGQSLPYADPDRLVMGRATFGGEVNPWAAFPDYMDYRDQAASLESLATIGGGARLITVSGTGEPEEARVVDVSDNLFQTLGVNPELGGSFTIDELPEGGGGQVVISHDFWQQWYGGDPDVVGRALVMGGNPMTVVGVMPQGFRFVYDSDLWIPPWAGNSDPVTRRAHEWILVGRLTPGATLESARAEIEVISEQLQEAYPDTNEGKALRLDPLHAALVEGYRATLFLLSGAIVLVLLVACGNVASLLLARGSARISELAVRSALGAGKARLTRQLLVECFAVALAAGGLGLVLAVWLQSAILSFVSMDMLGIEEVGLSRSMLGIALVVSLGTVVVFGVFPSMATVRGNHATALKDGARGSTSGRGSRYRGGLVVLQVALSLVLLVGTGLLIRSIVRLTSVDPGFRVERLLTATVKLPADRYAEADLRVHFFDSLRRGIEELPGVETVAMVNRLPFLQGGGNIGVWAPERPPDGYNDALWADQRVVLPGYFEAMGIPLIQGRDFQDTDTRGSPRVIILSRATAEFIFPDETWVGRQVAVDVLADEPVLLEVVGVVENHHIWSLTVGASERAAMFFPYAQRPYSTMRIAVRCTGEPSALVRPIQEQVWELERGIVLSEPRTMESAVNASMSDLKSISTVLAVFASVATALAALGLYGVLAFFVTRRTHEIGIRVALGATRGRVLGLVIRRGMLLVALGAAVGIAGAVILTRFLADMLFEISTVDPATYLGTTALFLAVGLVACLIPALRALRADPLPALRTD